MSPVQVLHFYIMTLIIDIVAENKDTNLLKNLLWSLIPSSRPVANVYLPPSNFMTLFSLFRCTTSSKKRFVGLLKSRLYVVKHIRKLTYRVSFKQTRVLPSMFGPRRSSALTHPSKSPPNNFSSQLSQNQFSVELE